MASGKLGSADLGAGVDTLLYTCPALKLATVNISLCNRGAVPTTVRIAVGTGGAPAVTDYLEYETPLPGPGVLERTGIAVSAGEKIWARTVLATVSARAHGFEEPA
ncbi:hypothetical protein [Undibacterium sp. Ren11W]|uniref:hypothetical protein n=1 Tax=Undibacterium sp. Ren11W TaxID=3413045 RepID=UPI003BF012F8